MAGRSLAIGMTAFLLSALVPACGPAHAAERPATGAAATIEPWADPGLPVTGGLALWLDAGRQPAAWAAQGKPDLIDGTAVDVCYDGSGRRRHFAQTVRAAQPKLVAGESAAALRFDGEDDHLASIAGPASLERFTVVIAAAPKSNPGGFRALLSAAELGKNDYGTGLNVDLGAWGSPGFDVLNVEGRGFGGMRNLLSSGAAFQQLQRVAITGGNGGVQALVNGQAQGRRDRASGAVRIDGMFLGSRYYSNDPAPPFVSGFLQGDIAEVLVYDRVLEAAELASVNAYLEKKHADYDRQIARNGEDGELLRPVEKPPAVQMFVPGFTARQLPLDLTNLNNLRYRDDGRLVALAYDGDVYLLTDTDNDGLEDKAELFWDNQGRLVSPIGMAVTPPGYAAGRGVFVASKGKVSLLLDADGDHRAEKEIVVATGWKPLPHQVDALGVAVDRDGSVYFGLGTTNFTNAYLTDGSGNAKYDLKDERGTILKVSPDFSKRQVVCTGIRFPVGLAFNRHGDLFATDQEGATWLPNGNPFDELLHIQPGRHYGFPPRHPKHLPRVIDEPSVFDYTPQHQSTCGLTFNEGVNGGPVFGPAAWTDNVLVYGESRGKLYRTQLARTQHGYVARNHLLASLTMLAVDGCVSPAGDLVIAVHSGNPDWGSGPKGKGKLYKIRYARQDQPQPVAVWAASPHEVRIAFDRPLNPAKFADAAKATTIQYGAHVAAGDRFEAIRPGYAVVQRQLSELRKKLPVTGIAISNDRQTLVISTARQTRAVNYALTLPNTSRPPTSADEIAQVDALDLAYDLTGVMAEWKPANAAAKGWTGWLPHPDLAVARAFTAGSAEHESLWPALNADGTLTLRTSLDLWNMLRPAVQPGSRIDDTLPPERVTVVVESNVAIQVRADGAEAKPAPAADQRFRVSLTIDPAEHKPLPIEIAVPTGPAAPAISLHFTTAEDDRPRALPVRRFILPWASTSAEPGKATIAAEIPQLKGGDWARGRDLFFGEVAACAKCHRVDGRGSDLGPDLSNLVHRDYDSVLRDIREPSGALNPDYIASMVRLKDGRVLSGILRSAGADHFLVRGDADGEAAPIHKTDIVKVTPSNLSAMPEGLDQGLSADQLRDLLTYLLTRPLEPAIIERPGLPPARLRGDVERVLAAAATQPILAAPAKKLNILLVAGPKDHGPSEHDYPLWQKRWGTLLGLAEGVTVAKADVWPTPEQWAAADVAVFYSANPGWNDERAKQMQAFQKRGGGLVFIHFAVNGQKSVEKLADCIGLAWRNGGSMFRHGPLDLTFRDGSHPITRGFETVKFVDESYWRLVGDAKRVKVLADAVEQNAPQPLLWTLEPETGGRVFVSIPGHYTWTFDDPLYRVLLLRAICWTANEPADRLRDLVLIGARVQE